MKFQSRDNLKIVSANANVDFAAAKKIYLAVKGGASIIIDGGITVQCPGTITVHASRKSFSGPEGMDYELIEMPQNGDFLRQYVIHRATDGGFVANQKYRITLGDGRVIEGVTTAQGETSLVESDAILISDIELLGD